MCLLELQFLCFSDGCPGEGFAGHTLNSLSVFKGASVLFSSVAAPICIPSNSVGRFIFLHNFSQHLLFLDSLNDGHSDQVRLITHCFGLHFSKNY